MSNSNNNVVVNEPDEAQKSVIRSYNDDFRKTFNNRYGKVLLTPGVHSLSEQDQHSILMMVRMFDEFTEDNDPHQEHDFGSIVYNDTKYFWKIDYYDNNYEYMSDFPETVSLCKRVLTIMCASEY